MPVAPVDVMVVAVRRAVGRLGLAPGCHRHCDQQADNYRVAHRSLTQEKASSSFLKKRTKKLLPIGTQLPFELGRVSH
jgi:hypothetical protein